MNKQLEYLKTYVNSLDKKGVGITDAEKMASYYVSRDNELKLVLKKINSSGTKEERLKEIEKYIKEKQDLAKDLEKETEAINKVFGLNLSKNSIEHYKLNSGIDVLSFYDDRIGRKRMIEYGKVNSLVDEFTNIQNNNESFQTDNYDKNALDIAKKEAEKNNGKRELFMVDIETYKQKPENYYIKDIKSKNNIDELVKHSEDKRIKYINLENCVALDADGNIVESYYDDKENKSKIDSPVQYKIHGEDIDNQEKVDNNIEAVSNSIDNNNVPSIDTDIPDNTVDNNVEPTEFEKKEVEVSSEDLNLENEMELCHINGTVEEVYDNIVKYSLDMTKLDADYKSELLTEDEFKFYEMMANKYQEKLNNKKAMTLSLNNPDVRRAGFAKLLLLSILTIIIGIILTIMR